MEIKLSSSFVERMKNQKETGMGWQMVRVKLTDGRVVTGLVLNSETLMIYDKDCPDLKIEEILDIVVKN